MKNTLPESPNIPVWQPVWQSVTSVAFLGMTASEIFLGLEASVVFLGLVDSVVILVL